MTQITEAYINSSSIPVEKLSFTFGIALTLQLEQTTNIMAAWFLSIVTMVAGDEEICDFAFLVVVLWFEYIG